MSYVFEVTAEEIAKMQAWAVEQDAKWIAQHGQHLGDGPNYGAIGGALTYCFTPTSIGVVLKVQHANGAEIDLTDYGSW